MKSKLVIIVVCLFLMFMETLPVRATDDNFIHLSGGVISVQRFFGSPDQWLITVDTSRGPVRVTCLEDALEDCSDLVLVSTDRSIPSLLNTGGCLPLDENFTTSSQTWSCDGIGTGKCRVVEGYILVGGFSSLPSLIVETSEECDE